jgi:hypothetical protein
MIHQNTLTTLGLVGLLTHIHTTLRVLRRMTLAPLTHPRPIKEIT